MTMPCDKETATRRLTNRWNDQTMQVPVMRKDVPLDLYIRRNLRTVMRDNLLCEYEVAK